MKKVVSKMLQASAVTILSICLASCYIFSRPFSKRKFFYQSNHFNGKRFCNPNGQDRTHWDFFKWLSTRNALPWPKKIPQNTQVIPVTRTRQDELKITFINHSTVLIQWEGINILTDPVWCERASPFKFMGPKRVIDPGVKLEDLPPLDLILVSHNHYDHMDVKTLAQLQEKHRARMVTGLGNGKTLSKHHIGNIYELDWWESYQFNESISIAYVPGQHFSSRGLFDRNEALWGGFVIQAPTGNLYFAGDTGYGDHFKEIKKRYGPISLAMLPIGAYKPEWFMGLVHNSPKDSVQAHIDLEAKQSLAIHWDTFHLGEEAYDDPPRVLVEEMLKKGLNPEHFWVMRAGEERFVLK